MCVNVTKNLPASILKVEGKRNSCNKNLYDVTFKNR